MRVPDSQPTLTLSTTSPSASFFFLGYNSYTVNVGITSVANPASGIAAAAADLQQMVQGTGLGSPRQSCASGDLGPHKNNISACECETTGAQEEAARARSGVKSERARV